MWGHPGGGIPLCSLAGFAQPQAASHIPGGGGFQEWQPTEPDGSWLFCTQAPFVSELTRGWIRKQPGTCVPSCHFGAENGIRTRDLDLGKVALYQLSYFRVGAANIKRIF